VKYNLLDMPDLRALDEHSKLLLIGIILNEPGFYLEELCLRVAA
jgi:hypothetical protein